uniref:Uncharacterized protein n=1 Tax=Arion vulgaris TaxID=1028688 RepID=A0A0B6ZYQ4_9EUPU
MLDSHALNIINILVQWVSLGRECKDCGNINPQFAINQLIAYNSNDDDDVVIYTNGSVYSDEKSVWVS